MNTQTVTTSRTIGAILVDAGKLTAVDAERVLRYQKEHSVRFGDAALALNLLNQQDIDQAFARQYNYPYLLKGDGKVSTELIAAYEPFSAEVEALRVLRSQLMLRWFTGEPERRVLAICGAGRHEGRSRLAANLAIIFSQLGERTLLVDADLRHPRQHDFFQLGNEVGLSSILAGRAGTEVICRVPELLDLSLLTAGPIPPNPQELLGQSAFSALLGEVSADFDVVIVDTPADRGCADTQVIASRTRAALIVARRHWSALDATRLLCDSLTQVGVNIVGSVLADF